MSPITELVLQSTWETVVMVFFSTLFAILLGFPLGIFLFVTSPRGIAPKIIPYQLISRIVNVLRSFPFVILMIVLFPLSRVVLGTAIGTEATIIPLSIAAAPFIARLTETALNEVDKGVIQAAVAMGASKRQVVRKVLIPEALPSIISGVTLTIITLIGYSAMAGAIGGGGLGDLAIRYGYQRFRTDVMIESVVQSSVHNSWCHPERRRDAPESMDLKEFQGDLRVVFFLHENLRVNSFFCNKVSKCKNKMYN